MLLGLYQHLFEEEVLEDMSSTCILGRSGWSSLDYSLSVGCLLLYHFLCCCLVTKSCLALCKLIDCSPLGSPVHVISQARILEWVAISFSKESSGVKPVSLAWQVDSLPLSHLRSPPPPVGLLYYLFIYFWSGLPFPSPRDLPDPGIKPRSPALQADALTSEPPGKPIYFLRPILTTALILLLLKLQFALLT